MLRERTFNSINLDGEMFDSSGKVSNNNEDLTRSMDHTLSDSFAKALRKSHTLDINSNMVPRISTPKLNRPNETSENPGTSGAPKILVFDCNNQPVKLSESQPLVSKVEPVESVPSDTAVTESDNKNDDLINKYLPQSKFGLGSDHADMIIIGIRYLRIVFMVYAVWLVGS